MKIGDYVRTQNRIFKITKLNDEYIGIDNSEFKLHYGKMTKDYYFLLDTYDDFKTQTIYKSSPRIIDLIEVGDYVNDEKIVDIGCLTNGPEEGTKVIDYYIAPNSVNYFKNEDIKSIVTKEAFESMEYKIGDE